MKREEKNSASHERRKCNTLNVFLEDILTGHISAGGGGIDVEKVRWRRRPHVFLSHFLSLPSQESSTVDNCHQPALLNVNTTLSVL